MTEAMPFLRNTILLSYDPRSFAPGFLHDSPSGNRKADPAQPGKKCPADTLGSADSIGES